ncbi:uncharacterized protein LOC132559258 [Ylistrum balloti]|uniref:uncharacterized protein LOC132559258 n=1 Tax=Ylistrum balloti TaxID=509963 RepID=UPI002905C3F4|nr:uncharacterized protein LOC132559258 [Ylistrum balloti]
MTDPCGAPPLPWRPVHQQPSNSFNIYEDEEDEIYTYLPEEEIFHKFLKINEKTEEDGTESGIYASEDFCKSQSVDDKDLNEIIRCINTADSGIASKMITHVHMRIIPTAVSQSDLETLALLMDCDHKAIERRVARVMTEVLFETDIRSHNYVKLLSCLNALFSVLQKRSMSPESMIGIQPIVILVLLVLYHQSLNHPDRTNIADTTIERLPNYIDIVEKISAIDSEPYLSGLRQSVQMILKSFQEVLMKKKTSRLQVGNINEELRDDRHRERLSRDFGKMSMLEHYSLIFGVIVQISTFPVTMEALAFVRECLASVLNYYNKKSRTEKHVYALLLFTTRAIINTLEKRHSKHSTRCSPQLCEILQMITTSPKIKKEVRRILQEEVSILLFHEKGTVVQKVSAMLEKRSSVVTEALFRYLTRTMESLSFSSHSKAFENSYLSWQGIHGTIVGHIHVTTEIFLPSLDSLINGSFDIDTYRQSAAKVSQTAEHYNTLKVLRKLSAREPNNHIKRLFAFQTEPIPLFYMTETLPETTLSSHLISHRKDRNWISDKTLGLMSLGAVKALRFLHDVGMIHRNIIADSFRCRGQTVVLSDFKIVKNISMESEGSEQHAIQVMAEIPIRWSPYESLCEDEFSRASDVWMFGQLLFEIFTHGCHPYTDIYGYDLEDVMDMVLFHGLKPKWWQCTPRAVQTIIDKCVQASPHERISLRDAEDAIAKWLETTKSNASHSGNITFSNRGNLYPELNQLQQDKPERGISVKLKQLKSLDGNVKDLYYNTLRKRKVQTNTLRITEQDLTAPDHPQIRLQGTSLHVEEPVTQRFINGPLDQMKSEYDFAIEQHIINFPPQKRSRECTVENGFTHTLLYRCTQGKCLLDIAAENLLGDPADPANEVAYANLIKEGVRFVSVMHAKKWVLRDICCSTLYRSKGEGKIFMPRIGRFLKCQNTLGCVTDTLTNTDDRRNWMPIEVLQHKTYSMASDVYMLAMTIYEFYETASIRKSNPLANHLEAVPFATLAPEKLLDSLYKDEIPRQPLVCPEWMYNLLKMCWNRDPTRRLSAHTLLEDIESMILELSDDVSVISCGNTSFGTNSARSTYITIAQVPIPELPPEPQQTYGLVDQIPPEEETPTRTLVQASESTDGYLQAVYSDSTNTERDFSAPHKETTLRHGPSGANDCERALNDNIPKELQYVDESGTLQLDIVPHQRLLALTQFRKDCRNHSSEIPSAEYSDTTNSDITQTHDILTNPGPTNSFSSSHDSDNTSFSFSDDDSLKIIHLNIRSVRNKQDFLESFTDDIDILCLTETCPDSFIPDSDLLTNFQLYLEKTGMLLVVVL